MDLRAAEQPNTLKQRFSESLAVRCEKRVPSPSWFNPSNSRYSRYDLFKYDPDFTTIGRRKPNVGRNELMNPRS